MEPKEIADEANRITHDRWPLYEKPFKEWMVRVMLEAIERLKERAVQG